MSNKDDPRFVKFMVRQTRAIFEGGIQREETPRWEREHELCSMRYPWLADSILEAFLTGIRRAYKGEHAFTGFDYNHLPNLLVVEKSIASQLEMLQLVNKEEDPDDVDMLWMSIQDIVQHMNSWVVQDDNIQAWEKADLLEIECIIHNACDHLVDFLINLRLSIDSTYKALQEIEVCMEEEPEPEQSIPLPPPRPKKRERTASESGQLGAV